MTGNQSIVEAYYPHIDDVDIDWVMALFHEKAIYQRAGAQYCGLSEIRKFFAVDRQIRGQHVVEDIWSVERGAKVFVLGRFDGLGAGGDPRSVAFADVWRFDPSGLITQRQTYLGLGHAYVER